MQLYQLLYKSTRNPNCDDAQITRILEACKRNNPSKDITGVLLHSDDHFIQYLEGDKDIIKLYDLIKEDERHSRVVLLSYGLLQSRVFPNWHMGYKNVSKEKLEFLTEANEQDQKTFNSIIKGEEQTSTSAVDLLVKFFSAK